MRSKTLIKKCNCMHCFKKQEQINRSKEYCSKVLTIPVIGLFKKKRFSVFLRVDSHKFKTNFELAVFKNLLFL